ncbi:MAG: hypothetical protein ACK2UF_05730, partial [Candidatus Promineifilaceae bacterium]
MKAPNELEGSQLYNQANLDGLDFKTTSDLNELTDLLGQPRASAALQFGMGMDQKGYNIFALGPTGTGKQQIL